MLKITVFVQPFIVFAFINSGFSAMVRISNIQWAEASSGESLQLFHKTETSTPTPLPSETLHNGNGKLVTRRLCPVTRKSKIINI